MCTQLEQHSHFLKSTPIITALGAHAAVFTDGLLFLSAWLLIGSLASLCELCCGGIPAPHTHKGYSFFSITNKQTEKEETVIPSPSPTNAGQSRVTSHCWSAGDALQSSRLFPIKPSFT